MGFQEEDEEDWQGRRRKFKGEEVLKKEGVGCM